MARIAIGAFSKGLTAEALGNALAGGLTLGDESAVDAADRPPDARGRLAGAIHRLEHGARYSDATTLGKRWTRYLAELGSRPSSGRFGLALELDDPTEHFEAPWLAAAVSRASGIAAVSFVTAPAEAAAEWLWPLDIGLLAHPPLRDLRQMLGTLRWQQFVQPVSAAGATAPIELLVVPASLNEAMPLVAATRALPPVQAVLVLGGWGDAGTSLAQGEAFRTAARAQVVCVVAVSDTDRPEFFDLMLIHLAHDLDLDVAVSQALREMKQSPPPPVLFGAKDGFANARISRWAASVGGRVRRLARGARGGFGGRGDSSSGAAAPAPPAAAPPPTATPTPDIAEVFEGMSHRLAPGERMREWIHETHDAAEVAAVGQAARATPVPPADQRHVQAQVVDADAKPETPVRQGPLRAEHPYWVEIWIGPPEKGALVAPDPFPVLPPSPDGHELMVVLTAPQMKETVQRHRLWLPPAGASERLRFALWLPAGPSRIDARITLLHENRVVQTLRLEAGVGAGGTSELRLLVEAVVRRDIDALGGRRRFDAALICNDLAESPSISCFTKERASLVPRDDDFRKVVEQIVAILERATNDPGPYGPPDASATVKLLADLARQGSELLQALMEMGGVHDDLRQATHLQIIAAKPEDVLPLEFCYDWPAPSAAATICPEWRQALATGQCPAATHGHDVVCPAGFWATNRIIERHVFRKEDARALDDKAFAIQTEEPDGRTRLNVLAGSLCAAADQARAAGNRTIVDDTFAAIKTATGGVDEVKDWEQWWAAIQNHRPALLVLLAHTEIKDTVSALVIGNDQAALVGDIDRRFVGAEVPRARLVLLLGCSTAFQGRAFQSFITGFRRAGAPIIVGTLSEILGRHAAPIAGAFLRQLQTAAHSETGMPLGELMTALRRSLLAEGYPIALTLAAFGDADWRI